MSISSNSNGSPSLSSYSSNSANVPSASIGSPSLKKRDHIYGSPHKRAVSSSSMEYSTPNSSRQLHDPDDDKLNHFASHPSSWRTYICPPSYSRTQVALIIICVLLLYTCLLYQFEPIFPHAAFEELSPHVLNVINQSPADIIIPPVPSPSPSASSSSTPSQKRLALMNQEQLFSSSNDGDTAGSLLQICGRGKQGFPHDCLNICTFTNVCAGSSKLYFLSSSPNSHSDLESKISQCYTQDVHYKEPKFCRSCFHPGFMPAIRPLFKSSENPVLNQKHSLNHVWSMHKWVRHHHIAHWAQKLLVFQAIYQQRELIDEAIPKLDGMVFHDTDSDISEHEAMIFNSSLRAALDSTHPLYNEDDRSKRSIWAKQLEAEEAINQTNSFTCFKRLSFTPHYGIFAANPDDTLDFRKAVYEHYNLPAPQRCPPRRAVLLYRHNRRMINQDAVIQLVKQYGHDIETATIDENSSSETQTKLFATTGLILSSHSSQLINVVFSPPGSSIIEIAPEFYNADFSEYAKGMGIFFQYALGGSIPDGVPQPDHERCVRWLSQCEGDSHCVIQKRFSDQCRVKDYPNKPLNFVANLTAVEIALKHSLQHLQFLCNGRW